MSVARIEDVPLAPVGNESVEQDRQRIRLFAGAAGGAPHAQSLAFVATAVDELRQHVLGQRVERLLFPEKIGFADREVIGETIQIRAP